MIYYCIITITFMGFTGETAVKGTMKHDSGHFLLMDFSKEAKKQGYSGDYSDMLVSKDRCYNEKELK